MVSPRSLSRVYVQLAVFGLFCSSCLAPGRSLHPAAKSVADNAPARQLVAQTDTASVVSRYTPAAGIQGDSYNKLPLSFEANRGQTDPRVKFLSRGPGYALFLTATEAVLALNEPTLQHSTPNTRPPTVVRMQLLGANPAPSIVGAESLRGKVNYIHGSDPALWHTDIPTYRTVQYQGVYPGIDLVYYGKQRRLEYDFIVAPGTDPSDIRVAFTDKAGQPLSHTLDAQGNLVLHTEAGEVRLQKPLIYQDNDGTRTEIAGGYAPHGSAVGFQVASYDKSKPLVIDPVLLIVYSTFLGGDRRDSAFAIAVKEEREDQEGHEGHIIHNVYLAGQTLSANFPLTADSVDSTADVDNGDAFVAKLKETDIVVETKIGKKTEIVLELSYATYLGGPGADVAKAIAVDDDGNAYIAGETLAPDKLTPVFPTTLDAVQPTPGGGVSDAFVAKLNEDGTGLRYSTYLGGEAYDRANGIAIDSSGNAYVAGQTLSDLFLPGSGFYTVFGEGPPAPNNTQPLPHDAFVVKLNATGTERVYTAVFSARAFEDATAVAVNDNGEAYVVGFTSSFNFPVTPNAFQGGYSVTDDTSDAFVAALDSTGTTLKYATYLGGGPEEPSDPSPDAAFGVTIDKQGNAVVVGVTGSPNFPTTGEAIQEGLTGVQDAFISIIDVGNTGRLLYSTYLGGENVLYAGAVATDSVDPTTGLTYSVYIAGTTSSTVPTTTCAVQPIYGGGSSDAFISKIKIGSSQVSPEQSGLRYATYLGGSEKDEAYGFVVDRDRNMYVAGLTQSSSFFTTLGSVQPNFGGTEDAFVTKFDVLSHAPCANLQLTMTDAPNPITIGDNVTYSLAVTNLGPDFATNVTVTNTLPSGMTLLSATPSTGTCVATSTIPTGTCVGTSAITCSLGTMTLSQTNTITIVAQATAAGTPINCASVTASGPDFDENNNTTAVNTSVVNGNSLVVSVSSEAGANGQIISRPEGIACPPDCTEAFPPGTSVNLTAKPDVATSAFDRWGGACSGSGTSPFCNLTVDGDLAVEASFASATGLAGDWVDLTQTCQVKGKKKQPRCRVAGTLKVINSGPVRAGKFITRFFFSDDPTLNAGYLVLKNKKVSALDAGSERLLQVNLRLPSGVNGTGKYVVAYVDADAQVAEGNETNNRVIFGPLP
jgi:uncharacterized repeat protein (TIGR01451 family)